ncbi:ABC transporter permease [Schumannella soli]|uniref:ABC transporter permease n=1 Tax=Schumannella soli TaxID=2590779 RepID=A0A506YAQ1_9MICO|nr:ABC transporter permease [Schumannella soli]TPW77549.1 ABC transporter permease [Schumannella soli]
MTATTTRPASSDSVADATAAPSRPPHRRRRSADPVPWWLIAIGVVVAGYFVLPTVIVIPMSFGGSSSFQFPPKEFSLALYERFFTDPKWIGSLGNSLLVAVLAALIATVFGTAAAVGLNALTGRLARAMRTLLMISMVTPAIVLAVAVYISFLQWRITGTLGGYVLAHATIGLPFVLVAVTSALGGFDRRLLRASASLGATPLHTFLRVTMPLIGRGVVTGALFAFVTSLDEVVIALFLRSPTFQTLPVQMYTAVTVEVDPTIAAASSLVVVSVTILLLIPQLVRRKTPRS